MMGSTCCKSPYSPRIPDLGKLLINCPIKLCSEMSTVEEPTPIKPSRKFSSSDISGPLPLGTVIAPPKRPPRRKKRRVSRTHSMSDIHENISSASNIIRSKSAVELDSNSFEIFCNNKVEEPAPAVHLSSLVVRIDSPPAENAIDSSIILNQPQNFKELPKSDDLIITDHQQPQVHQLISLNKRTFLAGLLEENNNNVQKADMKDNILPLSRRSSITESLKEFESSLYEMLSENAEDTRSEQSLSLPQVVAR